MSIVWKDFQYHLAGKFLQHFLWFLSFFSSLVFKLEFWLVQLLTIVSNMTSYLEYLISGTFNATLNDKFTCMYYACHTRKPTLLEHFSTICIQTSLVRVCFFGPYYRNAHVFVSAACMLWCSSVLDACVVPFFFVFIFSELLVLFLAGLTWWSRSWDTMLDSSSSVCCSRKWN